MKNKILGLLLLGVIIAFATYVYKYPPREVVPTIPISKEDICMDYSNEDMNQLNVNLIHKMVHGYKDNQLRYIKSEMTDDAHSIWFDLETLKKFIYQLENKARKNAVPTSSNKLGVRIYYASYPKKDEMSKFSDLKDFMSDPLKSNYGNLHTLVMIPTINTADGNVDFNPLDADTYSEGLKGKKNYLDTNLTSTTFGLLGTNKATATTSSSTGAQNHGNLIPPGDPIVEGFYP
jgi:hypothetical protein